MPARTSPPKDLVAILREGVLVEQALQRAAVRAIREHKKEGLPLAVWRDGEVAWVPAEELEAQIRRRDLSDLVGSWEEDPETEAVLEEQRRIDPDDWR